MPHSPPRLLLGCTLLFWGAMSGRPLLALFMALVVEGSHWTRVRWDFNDTACGRAWRIAVAAVMVAAVLIWLDGNRFNAMPVLLSWMPLLLMPMQFVQSYGMRAGVPVSELSFLAKRRRERNQRLGLQTEGGEFNFGNVLFTTSLVAAGAWRGKAPRSRWWIALNWLRKCSETQAVMLSPYRPTWKASLARLMQ